MSVATGPVYSDGVDRRDRDLQVGFRVLMHYEVATDNLLVRLDMKVGGVQFNTGFCVRPSRNESIGVGDDLVMPKMHQGFSVVAYHEDLINAFRGMADKLEQQLKDNAEKMKP